MMPIMTRNYQKNVRKPKIYISLSTILHQRKRRCGKIFLKNCFQKWVNVLPFSPHFIPTMVITVTLALIALSITMPI